MTNGRGDAPRVAEMHRHTRRGLALSGAFAVAAVVAVFVPDRTGAWLPLHLFLVGSVTTAVSTVTQMLAVTWSASPAPPRRAVTLQRWVLAVGVVLVVGGRESGRGLVTEVGGAFVASALVLVAVLLVGVRRTVRTPRFVPAIDAYVLALGAAVVGVGLGVGLHSTALPPRFSAGWRDAHVIVNLFAFVGVVIAGTLPYFTATQARTKMSPLAGPTRVRAITLALWASAGCAALAAGFEHRGLTAVALLGYGVGVVALASLLPQPRRKQFAWAGPRLVQLLAGIAWWAAMTVWIAVSYEGSGVDRAPLLALVIGGFGQIMAASFAYLVPVVRGGGHEQLGASFRRTRSWPGLVLGNLTATLALFGHDRLMTLALAAWLLDAALRTANAPRHRTSAARSEMTC